MTLKEIVQEHLTKNGYAGLYNLEGDEACICIVEEDFLHCECENMDCTAVYKVPCTEADGREDDFKFCLSEEKPKGEMEYCYKCLELCYTEDTHRDDGFPLCEECYRNVNDFRLSWSEEKTKEAKAVR